MDGDEELWDRAAVLKYFGGVHTATLYRGIKEGRYPQPINVSASLVRWIPSECREARERLMAARADRPPSRRGRPKGCQPLKRRGPPRTVDVRHSNLLTASEVAAHVKRGEPGMWGDGNNLYLKITRHGRASWIFRYNNGGQKQVTFGLEETVALNEARKRALDARKLLASGVDPQQEPANAPRRAKKVNDVP